MANRKNVRIAKQLVRLAKSLVADGEEEQQISPNGNSPSTGPDVEFHACVFRQERHDARECDLTNIREEARAYFGRPGEEDDECYGFFLWINDGGRIWLDEHPEKVYDKRPALDPKLVNKIKERFKKLYKDCEKLVGWPDNLDITPPNGPNPYWFVVRIRDGENKNKLVDRLERLERGFYSDVRALGVRINWI